MISLLSYEDLSSNGTNWTPAIKRAIKASCRNRCESIFIPVGNYVFKEGFEVPRGIRLVGDGCTSMNLAQGTVLVDGSTSDTFISFTGENSYLGGGGGLYYILIAKEKGFIGGTAIGMYGQSTANRAGFTNVCDVNIYSGSDAGQFNTGILIDGSLITTSGSAGIRDINLHQLFIAGCKEKAMCIINGVHVYGTIQTAPGALGNGDVLIGGKSTDIQLNGRIYGKLVVGESKEVTFLGRASEEIVAPSAVEFLSLRSFIRKQQ